MAPTTQAAFARRHGVSKKTVTIWKRQGRVVMVGSLVDVAATDALLQGSGHGRFRRSAAPIPLPPDPYSIGATDAALAMLYEAPALAASLAVDAGASIPAAFALYAALSAGLALHLGELMAALGAEPLGSNPDAPIFHPDKRREVDWAALAEDAGGVFDRAACEAHLAATYGGNAGTLRTGRTRGGHPISRSGPATPHHGVSLREFFPTV